MRKKIVATAILGLLGVTGAMAQAANVQGGSSTPDNVQVGTSNFPTTAPTGYAGIRMLRNDGTWSGYVNIAAAPVNQVRTTVGTAGVNQAGPYFAKHPGDAQNIAQVWWNNQNAVADVYSLRQVRYLAAPNWPHFGGLVIGQVKGQTLGNVFFGEWSAPVASPSAGNSTNLNMASSSRTVWYVGDNAVTATPALSNVAYNVVGIRRTGVGTNLPHAPNLYSGVLTANYNPSGPVSGNTLGGTLSRTGDANVTISATINGTGQFNGTNVEGRFYNNANALAGIYTGGGVANHIAFGGQKQ